MPSEKFRITTNGQSLRNPNNGFFDMTLSANMTLDESDVSAHNDRRSAHNALERQRREHLNVKFQQLAHALPALQTVRRPSKTMIVAKSLEFVSSSLKRETTFTSEIQKLRLENEKLRNQAEIASSQLKKRLSNAAAAAAAAAKKSDESETSTLIVKDETKPSLKRKPSFVDPQLSPPPTPEAMRKPHTVVIATPVGHQQKKKKMVKQTKGLPVATATVPSSTTTLSMNMAQQLPVYVPPTSATSMMHTPAVSLIDSPWSPVDDNHLHSSLLAYPTMDTPHYFDMIPASSSSNANMLYDLYTNNMHPMLLSPYYIPSAETATTTDLYSSFSTPNTNHQRQHTANSHDFYSS